MNKRRKLLLALSGASAATVWTKPVVNVVSIPAHAQTSMVEFDYSETMGYDLPIVFDEVEIPDQTFDFNLDGATPTGDGAVTISNLAGDLNNGASEQWTIAMGGVDLGLTNNNPQCDPAGADQVFNVTLAALLAAISSDNIQITATNGGDICPLCDTNTMDVTLNFPAIGPAP